MAALQQGALLPFFSEVSQKTMKNKLIDSLKEIFQEGQDWVKLEVEYMKLTAAEKVTILLTSLIFGAVCLLIGMVMLIILALAAVDAFKLILSPWLACLCVAAILMVLILILYFFRKHILLNPIARLITRIICDAPGDGKKTTNE